MELSLVLKQNPGSFVQEVQLSSDTTGLQLKQEIHKLSGIHVEDQKLLACGKFLKNEATLGAQGVKNKATVMILKAQSAHQQEQAAAAAASPAEPEAASVDRMAAAARALAQRTIDDDVGNEERVLELVDQNGKRVRLSPEDEAALKIGMAMHEKGKQFMKDGDFKTAVGFFEEAERNFLKCKPEFLNAIDNFGLLCLDLAWCYFKLQDMSNLQNAQWRLQRASDALQRAHGKNMERLQAVKGAIGPDLVVYIRLHLLQGILMFYQHRMSSAASFFELAEKKIEMLKVDDSSMVAVMNMGFSDRESRLGLRAHRDLESATAFILKRRQQQEEIRAEEQRKAREQRQRKRFGKTADGHWVDVQLVQTLTGLGFASKLVVEALRQTNNNQDLALNLLTQSPHLLQVPDNMFVHEVKQLCDMGYSAALALGTLRTVGGSVQAALDRLLNNQGTEAPAPAPADAAMPTADVSLPSAEPMADAAATIPAAAEELLAKQQAEEDLLENLDGDADEDAHLDVSFDEEEQILREFKAQMGKQ